MNTIKTTVSNRVRRMVAHGKRQLTVTGEKITLNTVGITFYLLKSGEIISYRQWNMSNQPEFIVSGSYDGCEAAKKRMVNA